MQGTDQACEAVARFVRARTGLAFASDRCGDFDAAIQRAMVKAEIADLPEYFALLRAGRVEFDDLIEELVVGETYFFREPAQFEFIRNRVLPEIHRQHEPEAFPRVWSAGCATGEEPYSLAILLAEEGFRGRNHLLATDISRQALVRARRAAYGPWSFRGVHEPLVRRYFRRAGHLQILDERVRRSVHFEYLNLALDIYPSLTRGVWGMDLILCRNVLIYFDRQTIRKIARRLFHSLADDGWLVTGASDPPLQEYAPFDAEVTDDGVFYQRGGRTTPHRVKQPDAAVMTEELPVPSVPPLESVGELALPSSVEALSPEPEAMAPTAAEPQDATKTAPDPLLEAEVALAAGDYARVLQVTQRLTGNIAASSLHVRALANLHGPEGAERAVEQALQRHPLSPELHLLRALLLMELERDDEAAKAISRAIYLDQSLVVAHFTRGSIQRRRGEYALARRAFRNALDLCERCPRSEVLPLTDGEVAGRLAEAAAAQLATIEGTEERA